MDPARAYSSASSRDRSRSMQNHSHPSRGGQPGNFGLFIQDWRNGNWLLRYFLASQVGAIALSMLCSAASIAMLATGNVTANLWLICAAGVCFVTALSTWSVLKRRFRVRFAVW